MRLIVFITEGMQIRRILDHIGVDSEPAQISPARGPPLWDGCDAQTDDGFHMEPDWDLAPQTGPSTLKYCNSKFRGCLGTGYHLLLNGSIRGWRTSV
jgi:hypothetical protein